MAKEEDEVVEVVDEKGRLTFAGCRGRVLVAFIVLAILFLMLIGILFRGMMTRETPPPRQRAKVEDSTYVSAEQIVILAFAGMTLGAYAVRRSRSRAAIA